jgi:RNA polymerase sigma factor (sigma-70 family)
MINTAMTGLLHIHHTYAAMNRISEAIRFVAKCPLFLHEMAFEIRNGQCTEVCLLRSSESMGTNLAFYASCPAEATASNRTSWFWRWALIALDSLSLGSAFLELPLFQVLTEDSNTAFFSLLEPSLTKLGWHIYTLTGDIDDAHDVVGDAILLAYKYFDTLRNYEAFDVWLFQIARRELYKYWRRKKIFFRLSFGHEFQYFVSPDDSEAQYDIDLLRRFITKLPAKQAETITLQEIGHFSLEEIRQIQGGALSGVKYRLACAKKKLRAMMSDGTDKAGTQKDITTKPSVEV